MGVPRIKRPIIPSLIISVLKFTFYQVMLYRYSKKGDQVFIWKTQRFCCQQSIKAKQTKYVLSMPNLSSTPCKQERITATHLCTSVNLQYKLINSNFASCNTYMLMAKQSNIPWTWWESVIHKELSICIMPVEVYTCLYTALDTPSALTGSGCVFRHLYEQPHDSDSHL